MTVMFPLKHDCSGTPKMGDKGVNTEWYGADVS